MLNLTIIKTKNKIFVKGINCNLKYYIFDGKFAKKTFNSNWYEIEQIPKKIEYETQQEFINYRYELIDKSFASEKIPLILIKNDVANYDEEEGVWRFINKYKIYQSLYEEKYDIKEPELKEVEFKIDNIFEIDEIDDTEKKYEIIVKRGFEEVKDTIDINDSEKQLLDKIIFPDLILSNKPCKFTSKQMYNIIRNYIKTNINHQYAIITSDYDFCFTVEKKIELFEPEEYTVDLNSLSMKKTKIKKFEKRYRKFRKIEIFSMTHSEAKYNNYKIFPEFIANNHKELVKKVDEYLNEIITIINEPLVDCPYCKGEGVIINKTNFIKEK